MALDRNRNSRDAIPYGPRKAASQTLPQSLESRVYRHVLQSSSVEVIVYLAVIVHDCSVRKMRPEI